MTVGEVSVTQQERDPIQTVSVYGLGYFGGAFLSQVDRVNDGSLDVIAYSHNGDEVAGLLENGSHPKFPGQELPENVLYTNDPEEAVDKADLLIMATPSSTTRDVLRTIKGNLSPGVILLNTAKALDVETGERLSKVYERELTQEYEYALFAGGTIAAHFFDDQPLGADIASENVSVAKQLAALLTTDNLYVNPTDDLYGVEMASALKNVVSVAAGIARGSEFDYGTETRIISVLAGKIGEVCVKTGARPDTFSIGSQCWGNDMFMSATGNTRNRNFGALIGQGSSVKLSLETMAERGKTVESVSTLRSLATHPELLEIPGLRILYELIVQESISSKDAREQLLRIR